MATQPPSRAGLAPCTTRRAATTTSPAGVDGLIRSFPWRRVAAGIGAVGVLLWAAWALHAHFGHITAASVYDALRAQPTSRVLGALGLTALSFACLSFYDLLSVRVAGLKVPTHAALLAGFTGNALSNTLGFPALTGSMVRVVIYRRFGITGAEVARIAALTWLALALGFSTMVALAELAPLPTGRGNTRATWIGMLIACGLVALVAWLSRRPRSVSIGGFTQPLPSARMALAQMAIGAVESAASVGALYLLLPADLTPPFAVFAIGCIGAVALGLLAHAPGGIGVFEAAVATMLSGTQRADLLAALLLYRALYNLLPFTLAAVTLCVLSLSGRAAPQFEAG